MVGGNLSPGAVLRRPAARCLPASRRAHRHGEIFRAHARAACAERMAAALPWKPATLNVWDEVRAWCLLAAWLAAGIAGMAWFWKFSRA